MVTVAVWEYFADHPVPVDNWTIKQRKLAKKVARAALDGVGVVTKDVASFDEGTTIYALRRLCTDDERRMVTEQYLSR